MSKIVFDGQEITPREEDLLIAGALTVTNIMGVHPVLRNTMNEIANTLIGGTMGETATQERVNVCEGLAQEIAQAFLIGKGMNVQAVDREGNPEQDEEHDEGISVVPEGEDPEA